MPKKTIKKVEVSVTGDKDACGHCFNADKDLSKIVDKKGGSYKYIPIDSPEGRLAVSTAKIKLKQDIDSIPIITVKKEVCDKAACSIDEKVFVGYDKKTLKKELGF